MDSAPQPTLDALRARAYRKRRRRGSRCVIIRLDEAEIEVLVKKGYLASGDRAGLQTAAEAFLSDALYGDVIM